ncbi:MAG: hypothetical protein Q7K43_03960 [Candidatus Woesearchaeota archaeon]|nr:hypothetical protein [Candidatus Woesearchaeota archaeon]
MNNYKIKAGDRKYSIKDVDGILYIYRDSQDTPFGEVLGSVNRLPSQGTCAEGSNLGRGVYYLNIGGKRLARERLLSEHKSVSQGRFPVIRPLKDLEIILVLPAIKSITTNSFEVPLEKRTKVCV